jgi:hypothetical protein
MDDRNLNDIHVTWQLGVFIVCLGTVSIPLGMIYGESSQDDWMTRPIVKISAAVVVGSLALMALAIGSRVRQARNELLPDGRPMAPWVLRQVAIGVGLCVFGTLILIVLLALEMSYIFVLAASCAAIGPGVLMIGRVLAPKKPADPNPWQR